MRMRYRLNIVVDGNTTEVLNISQSLNTQNLSVIEYRRCRNRLLPYQYVHFVGASSSIKRIGDSSMIAAASGSPVTINAMTAYTRQGPRIRVCNDKWNDYTAIVANPVGMDNATNVKTIPHGRSGVKVTKYTVLKREYAGKGRLVTDMFPDPGTASTPPAAWTGKNIADKRDDFYGNVANDVAPNFNLITCDSFPIPPLPTAPGSTVSNANSVTIECFTNYWFKGFAPKTNM